MTTEPDELDETEIVRRVTAACRRADNDFREAGGSSRHWVRDHFLPYLRQQGLKLVADDAPLGDRYEDPLT